MCLALLVALFALPLLVIDRPAVAVGLETAASATAPDPAVIVVDEAVSPDIDVLAERAESWGEARVAALSEAAEEGAAAEAVGPSFRRTEPR